MTPPGATSSWCRNPGGALMAQMIEPMRVTQIMKPVAVTNPKPGVYVVDMGQNFYGTVRMRARGPRGTEVRLTSAYSLLPDGMLKTADNRHAAATDVYVFKGEGEEVWTPRFKGQGYRRVQVTGFPGVPTADHFEGLVIHTDTEPAGAFACSNELVNQIHTAMHWGFRMFLRSAPMDPDRDERQAWMGDPAKDSESEAFNFNVAAFYTKWMDDVRRSQRPNGTIPEVSMYWDFGLNSIDWPSVYTIIPDWFVDFYADERLSQVHYASMKRWVLAMEQHNRRADGTYHGNMFGDWCDTYTMDGKLPEKGKTDVALVHTAYHYNNCRILARAAARLGMAEDVTLFNEMAVKIREAFNAAFLDPSTGVYSHGTQTSHVLPLAFGMVPEELRAKVIENLVNDILVTHKGHLSVGLIGMQWLMQTLTDIGRPDVAWTIVTQTTRPSWGYMMSKGATTIWERWDTDTRDPGMNSEALLIQAGNLDAWFYQTLAGINYDKEKPGFKHIVIRPRLLGDPPSLGSSGAAGLTWVKAHHDSMYGRIASEWKLENGKLTMHVTIPPNTMATVHVPAQVADAVTEGGRPAAEAPGVKFLRMDAGAAVYEVGSGCYTFESR
jgi:alpha-L-rhamnosidase